MSWEQRGTAKYFYEAVWEDGRVVKKYIGRGEKATKAAAELLDRESRRQRTNVEIERYSRQIEEINMPLRQMRDLADQIMKNDLLSKNFIQAGRVWRKRRRSLK